LKEKFVFKKSENNICTNKKGTFTIIPDECYKFKNEKLTVDILNQDLDLNQKEYLIKGEVHISTKDLPTDLAFWAEIPKKFHIVYNR